MRKFILLTIISMLAIFCRAQPYQIGHSSITLTDASRSNRSITTEVYYPSNPNAGDKFPLIVFGHGFSMNYDAYAYLWNELVPKGYIIIFPTTEIGPIPFPSHSDFGKDMAYVITWMQQQNANSSSTFYQRYNGKAAVMGHSMGGGCSYLAAENNPNVNAIVNFAAAETNPSAVSAAANVSAIALVFAGSKDCIAAPSSNQIPMYNALSSVCKTYVNITDASHCQFADNNTACSFGELTSCPFASTISRSAQHSTTLQLLDPWLDFVLKGRCDRYFDFENLLTTLNTITYQQSCNVTVPTAAISVLGNPYLCAGQSVQLTASPTGMQYQWSTGDTSIAIQPNQAGTYKVVVANNYNCKDSATSTVYQPQTPLLVQLSHVNVHCGAVDNGQAIAVGVGGYGGFQYNWSGGVVGLSGDTINQLSLGTYLVTVADAQGCTVTDNVYIDTIPGLALSVTSQNVACYGDSSGKAWVAVNGGSQPFQYLWSNGAATDSVLGLSAADYQVTVQDASGCIGFDSVLVNQPYPLYIDMSSTNASCLDIANGSAIALASGGNTPYQYAWSNGSIADIATALAAGRYYCSVVDSNGCLALDSIIVLADTLATPTINSNLGTIFCNGDTALVDAPAGYAHYQWSTCDTLTQLMVSASGNVWVKVTDTTGCQANSDTINITVNQPYLSVQLFVAGDTLFCNSPTGVWLFNDTLLANTGNYIYPIQSGNYSVQVMDSNGCMVSADTLVDIANGIVNSNTGSLQLSVYPNPVGNYLQVQCSSSISQIEVFDMAGCCQLTLYAKGTNALSNLRINCSQLALGMYLAKITTQNGQIGFAKFVRQQ